MARRKKGARPLSSAYTGTLQHPNRRRDPRPRYEKQNSQFCAVVPPPSPGAPRTCQERTGLFSRADLQLISTLLPAKAEDEEEEEQTAARAPRRKRRSRQTQSQSQGGRREQRSAARDAPLPKTSGGSPLGESGSLNGANALLISRGTDAVRGSSLEDRRSSIREELGCERNARQRKTMEALQSKGHMVREEVEEWQSLLRMDPLEKDEVVEEEPDPKHDTRCAVHLNVPGLLASVYLGDFCKLELGECVRLVSGQRDTLERVLKESK